MKIPVAFDPNNLNSGKGVRRGTISVVTNNTPDQNLEVTWYTSLDSGDNLILTNDSLTLDKQPDPGLATPLFWPTARDSASFLETINGLPRSPKNITDMGTAWEYLASKEYFILDPNNPLPNIVTDGLILDVEANQPTSYPTTGSTAYDLSGVGNDGTLVNGVTFDSRGWFDFDGTDDEITVPDNSTLDLTTDMSFEFLVKVGSSQNNPYPRLIDKSSWLVHLSQTSPFSVAQNINTTSGLRQVSVSTGTFIADKWAHIFTTYDGQVGKIYENGKLVNTRDFGSVLPCTVNNTAVTIGGETGTSRQLNGSMAKTKIYNRALPESDVKQNYYGGPIVTDGLVLAMDAGNLVSYESGSTTTYSLTGLFTGSLNNGVSYLPNNGGTWDFDGTDDIISLPLGDSIISDYYYVSLEAWIKVPPQGNDYACVLGTRVGNNISINIRSTNNRLTILMNTTPTGNINVETNTTVANDEWHHIVASYDNGTLNIYVDGVEVWDDGSRSGEPLRINASLYGIGGDPATGARDVNGLISSARIYNKALTAEEVSQNFNAQKSRFGI